MKCLSNVLAMLVVVAIASAAYAADAEAPKVLAGVIAKVDATAKTIDVKSRSQTGGKTVTVTLADDATITLDGKAATLADLKEGQRVKVTPPEGKATKVEAQAVVAKKGHGEGH